MRRIYGDFSDRRLGGWHRALARHALIAQQQFTVAAGKNAADIALVVDAMDLLHAGAVDGYGHSKLLNLVADTGAFELNKSSGTVLIRPRDANPI